MSLGEPKIKRALEWVLARLADDPRASRSALIDQASREFDLAPPDADFLFRQLVEASRGGPPGLPHDGGVR